MGSPGSSRVRGGGRANWARKCWDLSPERHSSGLRREPWELTSVLVASKWWQPKEPLNCVKTVELNITCTNIIICSVYHHLFPPFSCWMRLKLFLKGLILRFDHLGRNLLAISEGGIVLLWTPGRQRIWGVLSSRLVLLDHLYGAEVSLASCWLQIAGEEGRVQVWRFSQKF